MTGENYSFIEKHLQFSLKTNSLDLFRVVLLSTIYYKDWLIKRSYELIYFAVCELAYEWSFDIVEINLYASAALFTKQS